MKMTRLITAFVLSIAVAAPAAASATTRQVKPGGGASGTCIAPAFCDFAYAVENAAKAGDTIQVAPGTYTTDKGVQASVPLTILGSQGEPRPKLVLVSSVQFATALRAPKGLTLSHVEVDTTVKNQDAVNVHGGVLNDDVLVGSQGGTTLTINGGSRVENSIVQAGPFGLAVYANGGLNTLVNVTAWGVGDGSDGVEARSLGFGAEPTTNLAIHNTIAHGDEFDLVLDGGANPPADVGLNADHSSFRPDHIHTVGDSSTFLNDFGGNIPTPPLLVDPTAGDFHEAPGSLTIDAGSRAAGDLVTGLDGEDRVQGAGVDIGADERVAAPAPPPDPAPEPGPIQVPAPDLGSGSADPAPVLGSLKLKPKRFRTHTRVSYTVSEPTTTRFRVERRAGGHWVKLRGGFNHQDHVGANRVRLGTKLRGSALKPGSYRIVAVATDSRGQHSATRRSRFRVLSPSTVAHAGRPETEALTQT